MDKETLQKKIESGDTVWAFSWATGEKRIVELNLQENEPEIATDLLYFWDKDLVEHRYCLESIFATKEEAEFELEFGNITWTETLKLPTWKQMQENIDWGIDCANRKWYLLKSRGHSIIRIEDWTRNGIYEEPLTYENYLEACRICKKLFLGEEL